MNQHGEGGKQLNKKKKKKKNQRRESVSNHMTQNCQVNKIIEKKKKKIFKIIIISQRIRGKKK